jgi:CRP/FNR family transcriptional regulator
MASAELPFLVTQAKEISLDKGICVFSQGQRAKNFLVVTQGCVTVFARSDEGKEVVLYRVQPGELCVLTTACLIGNTHYPAEAVTSSDTRARVIPYDEFEQHLDQSESFRRFVFAGMGSRLAQVTKRFELMVLTNVEHRLAGYILKMTDTGPVIETTHEQIATEIASAREVVSRKLNTWAKAGFIKLERGKITVIDAAGLKAFTSSQ